MDESLVYSFYLVIGPFLLAFLLQYMAGRVKRPTLRRRLSLVLSILVGGGFLFSLLMTAATTDWSQLGWIFLDCMTGSALAGVGFGRLLTRNRHKK